jgi:hypothetical protein
MDLKCLFKIPNQTFLTHLKNKIKMSIFDMKFIPTNMMVQYKLSFIVHLNRGYIILWWFCFLGITGSSIKMDHNGDSEGNFSVAALKPYRYVYSTKMYNFTCDYFILPVAGFQQGENPVRLSVFLRGFLPLLPIAQS